MIPIKELTKQLEFIGIWTDVDNIFNIGTAEGNLEVVVDNHTELVGDRYCVFNIEDIAFHKVFEVLGYDLTQYDIEFNLKKFNSVIDDMRKNGVGFTVFASHLLVKVV